MLFDPARHETPCGDAWDAARASDAIVSIVDHVQSALGPDGTTWPLHPLDDDGDTPPGGFKGLYLGSAGVWWSLWALARRGCAPSRLDPAAGIARTLAAYLDGPDTGSVVPSYFLGEVGVRLVHWRLTGDTAGLDALAAAVERNVDNPTLEALWAAPGTMLAAWHLGRVTGEARWSALLERNVEFLWQTWQRHDDAGAWLWTQDLYGRRRRLLGAAHGFAGNVYALLRDPQALGAARLDTLVDRCAETLQATAIDDGDASTWPPAAEPTPPGRMPLMQWCHGAPGIVTALADLPPGRSPALDRLLRRAGEAVWRAGPLAKGPGLCHGTAGNGYAFLKLYRRDGDPQWLERARAFAMHAIRQVEAMRAAHGLARCTLWTGDLGVAHYLADCREGTADWPSLDTLD